MQRWTRTATALLTETNSCMPFLVALGKGKGARMPTSSEKWLQKHIHKCTRLIVFCTQVNELCAELRAQGDLRRVRELPAEFGTKGTGAATFAEFQAAMDAADKDIYVRDHPPHLEALFKF